MSELRNVPATLHGRLWLSRTLAGLRKVDAAEAVGVNERTVTNWETGATSPTVLGLLNWAHVMDQDPAWFIAGLPAPMTVTDEEEDYQ